MATAPAAPPQTRALTKYEGIRDMFLRDDIRTQLALALPGQLANQADRLIRILLTAVQKTPALQQCEKLSIYSAVLECAQLGLMPDGVLGDCYLVPFGNKAQLIIGYKGLMKLARQSGEISAIWAEVVYEVDEFDVSYGLERNLTHKPALENPQREQGKIKGAYAVVKYRDGVVDFEYLSFAQIEKVRNFSKAGKSGPWQTHFAEMAKKTAIRKLAKRLPLTAENYALNRAIAVDERADMGLIAVPPASIDIPSPEQALPGLLIDDEQQTALMELASQCMLDDAKLLEVLGTHGFDTPADVTAEKFEVVCDHIQSCAPPLEVVKEAAPSQANPSKPDEPVEAWHVAEINRISEQLIGLGAKPNHVADIIETHAGIRVARLVKQEDAQKVLTALNAELKKFQKPGGRKA